MTLLSRTKRVLTVSVHSYTSQEKTTRQLGVKWKAVERHITRNNIFHCNWKAVFSLHRRFSPL